VSGTPRTHSDHESRESLKHTDKGRESKDHQLVRKNRERLAMDGDVRTYQRNGQINRGGGNRTQTSENKTHSRANSSGFTLPKNKEIGSRKEYFEKRAVQRLCRDREKDQG